MIRTLGILLLSTTVLLGASRGIRNNNPGNIIAGDTWLGRAGTDGKYVKFKAPEYGIRAMGRVIRTYRKQYKINTISGIIKRWAPPSENNTQKYINYISLKTGLKPSKKLNIFDMHGELKNSDTLKLIISAIIKMENGSHVVYPDSVYDKAFKMLR